MHVTFDVTPWCKITLTILIKGTEWTQMLLSILCQPKCVAACALSIMMAHWLVLTSAALFVTTRRLTTPAAVIQVI